MMTSQEFRLAVRHGTLVRWDKSGIVEQVLSDTEGIWWAINPLNRRKKHKLHLQHRSGRLREVWHCTRVDMNTTMVSVRQIVLARYYGEPLRTDATL